MNRPVSVGMNENTILTNWCELKDETWPFSVFFIWSESECCRETPSLKNETCNCSNAPNLDCMLRLKHNQHRDSGLAACLTCTLSKKTERFNKASPLTKFSLRGITSLRAAFCDCTSSGRFIVLLKEGVRDREREREVNTEQNVSGKLIYPRLLVQASRKKEICHRKQVRNESSMTRENLDLCSQ